MAPQPELEKVIFVSVLGGVAEVCEDTVPPGIKVEIIDFDNLNDSPDEFTLLSPAAQAYLRETLGGFVQALRLTL